MSLKFGLNVKAKPDADNDGRGQKKRATIFDDDLDAGSDEENNEGQDIVQEEELLELSSLSSRPSLASKPQPKPKPTNKSRPNIPPTKPPSRKPRPLDLDDHDDDNHLDFGDLSTIRENKAVADKAEALDPTIYDYDAFHAAHSHVQSQKKAAERQDAVDRKPRYIGNLLDAAARRKQDQMVAKEKLLQKERENEGDEFKDTEKFVTGAYKAQQEETRLIEEEEKRKAAEEEERRRKSGGGMQGFYKTLMGQEDKRYQEAMEAAARLERGEIDVGGEGEDKTEIDLAKDMRAKGVNVHINDEGQITDKRQLLSAGLNVAPAGKTNASSADHLKAANQKARVNAFQIGGRTGGKQDQQQAMRERQTRMLEEQLEQTAKRKREEEEAERAALEAKSKSRKTETDISSAKERYLARKREQEEAKKKAAAS